MAVSYFVRMRAVEGKEQMVQEVLLSNVQRIRARGTRKPRFRGTPLAAGLSRVLGSMRPGSISLRSRSMNRARISRPTKSNSVRLSSPARSSLATRSRSPCSATRSPVAAKLDSGPRARV